MEKSCQCSVFSFAPRLFLIRLPCANLPAHSSESFCDWMFLRDFRRSDVSRCLPCKLFTLKAAKI